MFKFCPNCGYKLNGNFKFCPSCGFKIETTNIDTNSKVTSDDIFDDDFFTSLDDSFDNELVQKDNQKNEIKKAFEDVKYYIIIDDNKNLMDAFKILEKYPNSFEFIYAKLIIVSENFTKFDSSEIPALINKIMKDFKNHLKDNKFLQYVNAYNQYMEKMFLDKNKLEMPMTQKEKNEILSILSNRFGITYSLSSNIITLGLFPDSTKEFKKEELQENSLYPRYFINKKKEFFYKDSNNLYFYCKPIQWEIMEFDRKHIVLMTEKILYASAFVNELDLQACNNKYNPDNFNYIDIVSSNDTFYDIAFNEKEKSMLSNSSYKNDLNSTTFKENDFVDDKLYTSIIRIPCLKDLKDVKGKNVDYKEMTPYAEYLWKIKNRTSTNLVNHLAFFDYWTRTPAKESEDKAYVFYGEDDFSENNVREIHGIVPVIEIDLLKLHLYK